jgi:hypothetical protein
MGMTAGLVMFGFGLATLSAAVLHVVGGPLAWGIATVNVIGSSVYKVV